MAITDNLQGYYHLDESSGNPADFSGNARTLTNNNTVGYVAGKIGNAGDFGAANVNKSFSSTSTFGLTNTGAMSVAMWVNVTTLPGSGTHGNLFQWSNNAGTASTQGNFKLQYANVAGTPGLYISRGADNFNDQNGVAQTLTIGTYFHIVFTYDATTMKLYLNGNSTPIVSQASTTASTGQASGLGMVFASGNQDASFLSGKLDEIIVWSRAITTAEVATLYNSGSGAGLPVSPAPSLLTLTSALQTSSIVTSSLIGVSAFSLTSSLKTTTTTAATNPWSQPTRSASTWTNSIRS